MVLPAIFDPIVNAPKPQKIVLGVLGLATIVAAARTRSGPEDRCRPCPLPPRGGRARGEGQHLEGQAADRAGDADVLPDDVGRGDPGGPWRVALPAPRGGDQGLLCGGSDHGERRGLLSPVRRLPRARREAPAGRLGEGDEAQRSEQAEQHDARRDYAGDLHVPAGRLAAGAEGAALRARAIRAAGRVVSASLVTVLAACSGTPAPAPPANPPAAGAAA